MHSWNKEPLVENADYFGKTPIPLGDDLSTLMAIMALLQNLQDRRENA